MPSDEYRKPVPSISSVTIRGTWPSRYVVIAGRRLAQADDTVREQAATHAGKLSA